MKYYVNAVLFDLDGVIVFTDKYHDLAWKQLSEENNWDFDEELNNQLRGIPRIASLEVILKHNNVVLDESEKFKFTEQKNIYYKKLLQDISTDDIYPNVIDFLKDLKSKGIKIALCSSSKNAQLVLDALKLNNYFDTVISGNDIENPKPHPEIFLKVAEKLNIHPFHCLVFEDAVSGVEAALSAKMKCVGVGTRDLLPNAPETIDNYDSIDIDALLLTGRPQKILAEEWNITETQLPPRRGKYWESIFSLSNGFIGVRGTLEEDYKKKKSNPETYVNGIYGYERHEQSSVGPEYSKKMHNMLNICDWTPINIYVEGEKLSLTTGDILVNFRSLSMKRGVLERLLIWESPKGLQIQLKSSRLVSMTRRNSAVIHYEITPLNFSGEIKIESKLINNIPSSASGKIQTTVSEQDITDDIISQKITPINGPYHVGLSIAHNLSSDSDSNIKKEIITKDNTVTTTYSKETEQHENLFFNKHIVLLSSAIKSEDVMPLSRKIICSDMKDGFDMMNQEQTSFWKNLWDKADIKIEGNLMDQQAVHFSLFQLQQNNPKNDLLNIGANGLSGNQYHGHIFWDSEIFMMPFFLYTEPTAAKHMLMYRYNILETALKRARKMNEKGALYAWNSISGEACARIQEATTAEYHLQSDIAYAIWRYTEITADYEFLYNFGAEIVFQTARFIYGRGSFIKAKNNQFCINIVCGPDEYNFEVNNNCYTNIMAEWHLRYATALYKIIAETEHDASEKLIDRLKITEQEVQDWLFAAKNMYIPLNNELGIHEQDDSFLCLDSIDMNTIPKYANIRNTMSPLNIRRVQITKQADVLLVMFLHGYLFSKKQKRNNYNFYEPKTNHGSPLSPSIHSIIASDIKKQTDAYNYFRQSALMDLNDFASNTKEGLHLACCGGTWMAVINGFAGMRDYSDGLSFNPSLPESWNAYSFKIAKETTELRISVKKDFSLYEWIDGPPIELNLPNKKITLSEKNPTARLSTKNVS
ncbi:MAG: beta-phosphoglucomutase [Verrucomicrobiota bacterium]|nr:beta-phosphoglucomutase [Verrucomicrobiota bacterium]